MFTATESGNKYWILFLITHDAFTLAESVIFMSEAVYFVDENAARIEVPVVRQGTDLSHTSVVWCATRMSSPPSATPGQDYIPHSKKIVFHDGEIMAVCHFKLHSVIFSIFLV